jgi:hypothetical protein
MEYSPLQELKQGITSVVLQRMAGSIAMVLVVAQKWGF